MIINLSNREVRLLVSAIKDQKNWYKRHKHELMKKENTIGDLGEYTVDEIIAEYESLELKLKP